MRERKRGRPDFRVDTDIAHQLKATDSYGNTNGCEERINLHMQTENVSIENQSWPNQRGIHQTVNYSARSKLTSGLSHRFTVEEAINLRD